MLNAPPGASLDEAQLMQPFMKGIAKRTIEVAEHCE
jgi:hypothetical protein